VNSFLAYPIQEIPFVALTLIIAFTVHEFAHAYTAYKFGDPTAQKQGRLTLNPMHHLDPLGTILIFVSGFGWARPVPVNRHYFKNPRAAGVLVSIMGPLSNLIMAFLGYGILYFLVTTSSVASVPTFILDFLKVFYWLNLLLMVFNLLPLPPLDGYRIIEDIVSPSLRAKLTQYEQYSYLVFLIIFLTPLDSYTITPLIQIVSQFFIDRFADIFSAFL
jgi:Zn-dependent protease